ncbi:MAG: hypothetical protein ACOY3I_00840 [Verrucomicrobiota bacterium]
MNLFFGFSIILFLLAGVAIGKTQTIDNPGSEKNVSLKNAAPLILPRNPNNRPPPSAISMQIEKFFIGLQQNRIDEAFQILLADSEYVQKKYQVDEFIAKTRKAVVIYGKINGYELYDNRPIGSRMVCLTYFVYLQSIPLRWRLIFYAADGKKWKLMDLSVDDLLAESIMAD